jgi:hypothetical protein
MPVKFARVSFPYNYLNISRRFSGILFLNIFHFGYQHHLLTYSDCKYSGAIGLVLVLYVCFVDRCLSFCPFSFGHCVVWSSSIYGF